MKILGEGTTLKEDINNAIDTAEQNRRTRIANYSKGLKERAKPFLDSYIRNKDLNTLEIEVITIRVIDNLGDFELIDIRFGWIDITHKHIVTAQREIRRLIELRNDSDFNKISDINTEISKLKGEILSRDSERIVRHRLLIEAMRGLKGFGDLIPFFQPIEAIQETNHKLIEDKTSEILRRQ